MAGGSRARIRGVTCVRDLGVGIVSDHRTSLIIHFYYNRGQMSNLVKYNSIIIEEAQVLSLRFIV